jgi:hypothetical protein
MAKLLPDMVKYLEGPALEYAVSELFKDPDSLAFAAADHGSPRWLLDKIAREGGAKLAVTVAANPSTSGETLEFITNCGKVTAERAAMAAQRNRKLYPGGMKSRSANTRGDVFDCVNRIAEYMRRSGAGESQVRRTDGKPSKSASKPRGGRRKNKRRRVRGVEYLNMGQIALCCAKIDPNDGGGTWLGEVEDFSAWLYTNLKRN